MKSLKLLIFAALAILFFACSSPAGSDANSTTVTNGTQNPTSAPTPTSNPNGNENGGSSTTLAPNECDMGGDFNLEDWVSKIYVNNKQDESAYCASNIIVWHDDDFDSNNHKVYLYIKKIGNNLVVEKQQGSYTNRNSWFEIESVVKTSDNRIDVTLKNAN